MTRIESLPGTRDFFPDAMRERRWIESRWREVAERYGFEEYDGPAIEPLELFTRKSGEEIVEQLYAFEDRGGRRVALRPEMTPTLARMVAARAAGMAKPIKWYAIPRLFRYERPQRGRFREFWQLNLDILGVEGVEADAELVAAAVDALRACGLADDEFEVRYSDRRLLDAVLDGVGVPPEGRIPAYAALDKLLRTGPDRVVAALERTGLEAEVAGRLVDAVAGRELDALVATATGPEVDAALERLERFGSHLDGYGVGAICGFDAAIVRGLAYYDGIVFEMHDRPGELRALCGGGRFDGLLEAVGGGAMPAVGFGLGDAVLLELLRSKDRLPPEGGRCDAFVVPISAADRAAAVAAVTELRDAGVRADLALSDGSVGRGLKTAAQAGARVAVLIGEAERASGRWTARDLATGEEGPATAAELASRLATTPSDGGRRA